MALSLCFYASVQGFRWTYLPLEDSQTEAVRRMAAIVTEEWGMIEQGEINAEWRECKIKENLAGISAMSVNIRENPRRPVIDPATGKPIVPQLPYHKVCAWVGDQKDKTDMIVIDPISQIDFRIGKEREWDGQDTFVRQIGALAEHTGIHIVLVAHVKKRSAVEKSKGNLSMDDICGSSAFSKFVQNVILLERHDLRENDIESDSGVVDSAHHKWSMYLDKARDGKGAGNKYAMDLSQSPLFSCKGTIIPQSKTPWGKK